MIAEARKKLREYDIAEVTNLGITRAGEHFGGSHTVVTYFPLNILGRMQPDNLFFSRLKETGPVNLYVHIPFCRSKCGYCSYVSEPNPSLKRVDNYISALAQELSKYGSLLESRKVVSIYIGGGTPTILTSQQLRSGIVEQIHKTLNVDDASTICVEANPVTLVGNEGKEKVRTLKEIETSRLSIGVQTFNDGLLRAIGRGYSSGEDARNAIQNAREVGILVLNVDMMQDLPGQTLEDIEADLEVINQLRPNSVTWYTMRTNPGCWLHNRSERPSEEDSLVARIMITAALKEMGYTQDSGDRFSLTPRDRDKFKEARSSVKSNLLGVGVSAYSHLDDLIFRNEPDTDNYMNLIAKGVLPVTKGKHYTREEEFVSNLILGLKDGVNLEDCNRYPSLNPNFLWHIWGYNKKIPKLIKTGLLDFEGGRLQFTEKGRLFENEVCRILYSPITDALTRGQRIRGFFRELWYNPNPTPSGFRVRA